MVEPTKNLTKKLLALMQETRYPLVQHNGQRKFGPPPDWVGPPPPKGCECFIGKLPREIYEDELVPLFSKAGKIYEMRLMMDFSGSNRGYAFVTYATKAEAYKAIKELNGYEIRPSRNIGVAKSVDNCRLFVGSIPKDKTKEEVLEELNKKVTGIVDVILYKNCYDRRMNRGFAFVEFTSHRAAAMARRTLVPGCATLWNKEVNVDWAEPEPDIDDEQMNKVKVLYVRNFLIRTTPETIKSIFETAINNKIERVKKIYDYAFIHFHERKHAELAMNKLQNTDVDGSIIEIKWAKPVDRELYRIQKLTRGNAKFNSLDSTQTMLLYKQHLNQKEYASSPKEDEGIGSACAGSACAGSACAGSACAGSPCGSPTMTQVAYPQTGFYENYTLAPAKLDSICKKYMWAPPVYDYQSYINHQGLEVWKGYVDLPGVGAPLVSTPQRIGPIVTGMCYSMKQAQVEAAENALKTLQMLRVDPIGQSSPTPAPLATLYPSMALPSTCLPVPYDYVNQVCAPRLPIRIPTLWRSV